MLNPKLKEDTNANLITLRPFSELSSESLRELHQAYLSSFPLDEQRPWEEIINSEGKLQAFAIHSTRSFIGFVTLWQFESFTFVEHLLILAHYRSFGYGRQTIEQLLSRSPLPLILEAEPAETSSLAQRRIDFYHRLGLEVQAYTYIQPPYTLQSRAVSLKLLANTPLDLQTFTLIRDILHKEVYGLPSALLQI